MLDGVRHHAHAGFDCSACKVRGRSSLVVTALSLVDSGDNWTRVRIPSPLRST